MISGFWALEYLGFCCCCCCFFLRICLEKLLSVSFVFVVLFAFLLRWLSFQFVSCLRRLMMFLCRFRVVLTDLRGFQFAVFFTLACRLDKLLFIFWKIEIQFFLKEFVDLFILKGVVWTEKPFVKKNRVEFEVFWYYFFACQV